MTTVTDFTNTPLSFPTEAKAPQKAFLCMDDWSGFHKEPVEIIGETPKRYRVKLLSNCKLPGRNRSGNIGDVILVPKHAVSFRS